MWGPDILHRVCETLNVPSVPWMQHQDPAAATAAIAAASPWREREREISNRLLLYSGWYPPAADLYEQYLTSSVRFTGQFWPTYVGVGAAVTVSNDLSTGEVAAVIPGLWLSWSWSLRLFFSSKTKERTWFLSFIPHNARYRTPRRSWRSRIRCVKLAETVPGVVKGKDCAEKLEGS